MTNVSAQIIPGLVVIDGPIGAGKTTLIGHVKAGLEMRGFRVGVIEELVPEDLTEYYKDPATQSYNFQKKFIKILCDALDKMVQMRRLDQYDFILCDRYYASTRGFIEYQRSQGFLTDEQVDDLMAMLVVALRTSPFFPEFFIFVDESNQTCLERIKARGRSGELATDERVLIDTNDSIKIFNSAPYMGQGPEKYVKALERAAKMCALEQELFRTALDVKTARIHAVVKNTSKCKVLPYESEADVVDMLSRGKVPLSHYEILAKERALVLEDLDPSALIAPRDPDADLPILK